MPKVKLVLKKEVQVYVPPEDVDKNLLPDGRLSYVYLQDFLRPRERLVSWEWVDEKSKKE